MHSKTLLSNVSGVLLHVSGSLERKIASRSSIYYLPAADYVLLLSGKPCINYGK